MPLYWPDPFLDRVIVALRMQPDEVAPKIVQPRNPFTTSMIGEVGAAVKELDTSTVVMTMSLPMMSI